MAEAYLELTVGAVCDDVESYSGGGEGTGLPEVKMGLLRFLMGLDLLSAAAGRPPIGHVWSFLRPQGTLYLWPSTTTEAVTVGGAGNKTLTVAADTFYQSMEGHAIVADTSENSYTIDAYSDARNITVTADASADDGDTFTITADGIYRMPPDFQGIIDKPVYPYSSSYSTPDVRETSETTIFERWRNTDDADQDPTRYAVLPIVYAKSARHGHNMIIAPVPSVLRSWTYRYRRAPVDITDAGEYLPGGGLHSYTIRQCALAASELRTGRTQGVMEEAARIYMARSISMDKTLFVTENLEQLAYGS